MADEIAALAQSLSKRLKEAGRDSSDERQSPLVGELRDALGLPADPSNGTAITIPIGQDEDALVLEPSEHGYVAKLGEGAPVVIETRKGPLVLDADDPLARVQRRIARIDKIKF